jgi:hypothetical protein
MRVDVLGLAGHAVPVDFGDPGSGRTVQDLHAGTAGKPDDEQRDGEERRHTTPEQGFWIAMHRLWAPDLLTAGRGPGSDATQHRGVPHLSLRYHTRRRVQPRSIQIHPVERTAAHQSLLKQGNYPKRESIHMLVKGSARAGKRALEVGRLKPRGPVRKLLLVALRRLAFGSKKHTAAGGL